MPSIPPKPLPPSLRALTERLSAALGAEPSTAPSSAPEPRNNVAGSVVAQSTRKGDPVAAATHALNRSQKRARARAARDRLGHKYGARAKAKKRARLEQARRADQRYEHRFRERTKPWQAAAGAMPRIIPRAVFLMAWDCVADATGAAIRANMRREPNQVLIGAAYRSALGCDAQGQNPTRTWASERARREMALALAFGRLAAPERRKGGWTGGVVRGIPQGALNALLNPPGTGAAAPHRNTLTGRHRGHRSDPRRGQAGYALALELGGAIFSRQPRVTERDVQPFEVGPRGFCSKRYYLVSPTPAAATTEAMRALLLELHRAGRLAVLSRPRAPEKPAFHRAQHPTAPALEAPS